VKIRLATIADAPSIAIVHVDTWRSAYRGIIPDAYLDNLSYERRTNFWHQAIAHPANATFVYVAEDATDRIVGFASGGPPQSEQPDYQGELWAIYVLQEHQGQGIGRQLVKAIARELISRSMSSMLLWVLKDNEPSRRFYESLGGRFIKEQQFELGGATLTEVGYGWPDITVLLHK
jgi:ribosomal protein S18 acetylase RimI-like enzyme